MKYHRVFFIFIFITACTIRHWQEEPPSEFLHLPIDSIENNLATSLTIESHKDKKKLEIFAAPDQINTENSLAQDSYSPKKDNALLELTDKNILMEVISHWDDGSNYKMIVQFINPTGEGINLNLNLYAYNKIGKLIRTQFSGIYFRPFSAMTQEFSFAKRGSEVRWIINLTGKK